MHGAVHDYVILKTIKSGKNYSSAEFHGAGSIRKDGTIQAQGITHQPKFKQVLEIGSLDVCGSMRNYDWLGNEELWRDLLGIQKYIGIDLLEGNGVDKIMDAHDLKFKDEKFDLVLCLQMLEHDSKPSKTFKEAYRVLKKGQPMILTCADENTPPHMEQAEHYRRITRKELKGWILNPGFSLKEFITHDNNFFTYLTK